ncbi:PREDICTED: scavenger receptor cysteine-rich type 1 protein M130-like, partial [Tinamus guttatus]|uniref:scavenger receptor cysteine-rich type 1 protein M130-like n=1 Tax=Tinamus guttatus TaxID=94827 RepID=UPI00052ED479
MASHDPLDRYDDAEVVLDPGEAADPGLSDRVVCKTARLGGTRELRLVDGGGHCAGRVEVMHEGQWGSVCSYDFHWDVRAVELRLVNGASSCEGRVEVKLRGQWGTVGNDLWDMEDAEVVCQQLGCGSAKSAHISTPFGRGSGPISLVRIDCRGDESALWECTVLGWGPYKALHDWDVGVICQGFVRLVGGDDTCSGRVEVRKGQEWATLCEAHMDLNTANVICKELGCGAALAYKALHDWDVGVICQGFVRLVGGDDTCLGRVEVRKGQEWATLCEAHMDLNAANVICKELACSAALAVTSAAHFGSGAGPIWDGGFECAGNESLLSACVRRLPPAQGCTHANDTGIICSPYTAFRLVNGSTACAGRVEVGVRGTWRSLCDTGWDERDAQGLCPPLGCDQLGCGFVTSVPHGGYFGAGSGPLWRDTFHCSGIESHLGACPATALRIPVCSLGNTAAVNCSGPSSAEALCLVGGESRCDGRLEVALHGAWGRVLAEHWDTSSASVVCRQLRCGPGTDADATYEAIYQELDYTVTPEYQDMPNGS